MTAPPEPIRPAAVEPPAGDQIAEAVVEIVSGLTGYPPDLLDVDLDLEADLGVDTVKQAEVFAAVRERFAVPRDDELRLRDFPTLSHVIGWVREKTGTPATPAAGSTPATAADPVEPPAADEVAEAVVEIVSGLTGYPPDLLDVDLDLEADLGVDTVKQAEVFAAVRERFAVPRDDELRLRDFPTLSHVIGWVREKTGEPASRARAGAGSPNTAAVTGDAATVVGDLAATDGIVRRMPVAALRPESAACVPTGVTLDAGTRVVVLPDQGGVGDALVTRLTRLGVQVVTLDPDDPGAALEPALAAGPVHGVYWLAALDDEGGLDTLDLGGWRAALNRRVRGLYTTMRRLYDDSPFLVTASRLGGYHGYDEAGATCPMGGAVTGFAKAYRRERPDALVKAVDFEVSRKTAAPADRLVEETLRDPGCVEVGYADGRRWGSAWRSGRSRSRTPNSARTRSSWSPVRPAVSCRRSRPTSRPPHVAPSTCST
ncbi:phosphopantetheine-binding protein [Paractinoplanes durhamensis]|uniref:phosphopantetheine-binding protein n=1 Tax=Paractinoplanes durhamensis TaxID=113563 RepID=UPI00363DD738